MAQNNKSGKITIANIVAMVGIVLLMVFSFIGFSFQSGGELGISVLKTLGVTAITVLLLWFLIKAKGAENNLKKWQIAEISVLVFYLIFTACTPINGGIMYLFVVNDNKATIKEFANNDFEKIDGLLNTYEDFERTAIANTRQGLMNATIQPNQRLSDSLKNFLQRYHITVHYRTSERVEPYIRKQQDIVFGSDYEAFKEYYNAKKARITGSVENWNTFLVPFEANELSALAKDTEDMLNSLAHHNDLKLPIIELNSTTKKYTMVSDHQSMDFHIDGGLESLQFQKGLTQYEGFSIVALVVTLLIHLLILFNYIVAYRTKTISVGKNTEDDGGIIL